VTVSLSCHEAVERLWDLLDGDLEDGDQDAVEAHLDWCLRCCGELVFAHHLRSMLRDRSAVAVPPDVHGRLSAFLAEVCEPRAEEPAG
jgi:anti-sigma factor (TIGR02949 family)